MTTIRGRLLVTLLAGLAVVLIAGGVAVYMLSRASLVRQFDEGLAARAQTLASLVTYEPPRLVFAGGEGPATIMAETFYELRTPDGSVIKRSASLGDGTLPGLDVEVDAGALVYRDVTLPGDAGGRAVWHAFWPRVEHDEEEEDDDDGEVAAIAPPATAPEQITVVAALDRGPIDRALATLLATLLVVGAALGAAVVLLVALGVRWGLVPLDRLTGQLGAVDGATISSRLDDTGAPRELAPIYRELNGVLDRVERTLERERAFADAAAHELRTPLAELRTTAEVAVRWPDADRAAAALHEVLTIGGEMERLVQSLLHISRGNATANGAVGETPVAPIVRSCIDRAASPIGDKHLAMTVDIEEGATLHAPRDAVEIIIRNLIDNAVRYTPASGRITVHGAAVSNGAPALVVENGPVALSEQDLPRLFEPFWRQQGGRSDREHVGLGLSVVHQIANAIGLRVGADLDGDRLRIHLARRD